MGRQPRKNRNGAQEMHLLSRVAFMMIIAVLTVWMVRLRPNARQMSRPRVVFVLLVGLAIAIVFLATTSIYAPAPAL